MRVSMKALMNNRTVRLEVQISGEGRRVEKKKSEGLFIDHGTTREISTSQYLANPGSQNRRWMYH
jgi:hypothetical protein